jgi:hypothetical protein
MVRSLISAAAVWRDGVGRQVSRRAKPRYGLSRANLTGWPASSSTSNRSGLPLRPLRPGYGH